MMVLHAGGQYTVTKVAEGLQVSLPNIAGLVDRLALQDPVERMSDPSDRRVVHPALSSRGRQVLSNLFAERTDVLHRIYGRLEESEGGAVCDALQALLRAIAEDLADS